MSKEDKTSFDDFSDSQRLEEVSYSLLNLFHNVKIKFSIGS